MGIGGLKTWGVKSVRTVRGTFGDRSGAPGAIISRHVGGAHAIAMSDGGQALHMRIQQLRERGCFCLAELGETRRDGLHRAVVLAELGAVGNGMDRGRITLRGERACDLAGLGGGRRVEPGTDPLGKLTGALAGELLDGLLAAVFEEEHEGAGSKIVIGDRTSRVTGLGERIVPGGTAAAALGLSRPGTRLAGTDGATGDHRVEVAPDACRGQAQPLAELDGGGRAELHQQGGDPIARTRIGGIRSGCRNISATGRNSGPALDRVTGLTLPRCPRGCFHNTSVP